MTVLIRPPVWPPPTSNLQPGHTDTRLAAQKAFFQAARTGRTLAAGSAVSPASSAPMKAVTPATTAEPAPLDRPPLPGSIIDIWV